MNYLTFYLFGFIVSYYLCKQLRDLNNQNTWVYVKHSFIISTLSWLSVMMLLVGISMDSKNHPKPPKGL